MTKRRIIYDDDGAAEKPSNNPDATVEGFLGSYFNSAVDTQVDSWFYNYGDCWLREDGTLFPGGPFMETRQSAGVFGDANEIIIGEARKAGLEIFASLRMNDIHCGFVGIAEPFKLKHPELMIGAEDWPGEYPHLLSGEEPVYQGGYPKESTLAMFYAAYNYAKPEVRQYRLDFVREFCPRYDWDGIQMDFMRHSLYFKPGEEEENLETMTGFMREARAVLNENGEQRGRPYLLSVRVPATPQLALRTGLDVETWLREGLIDLLVVSTEDWLYFTKFSEFVDLGHRCGVPVYLCHNAQLWNKELGDPGVLIRSIASNFWASGADGVYLFNFPYWSKEVDDGGWLKQIGDPDTLAGFEKHYRPEVVDVHSFNGYVLGPDPFPQHLVHGASFQIVVGDDVERAAREGLLKEMLLKVDVDQMHHVEGINIRVNGIKVSADDSKRVNKDSFELLLEAPPLKQGLNEIVVLPGRNSIGRLASVVTGLDLWVRYRT